MPASAAVAGALSVLVSLPALAAERVPIRMPAEERLPVVLVSSSAAFDRACPRYYRQGNDPDVMTSIADEFCTCIAGNMEAQGLGSEVMDFLARTYSEDLTTFIDDYPDGQAWMDAFFAADQQCKNNTDFGSNQPPADEGGGYGGFPIEAGTWGGIVRSGPGQEFSKLASLAEGELITLIENTGVWANDYPWFRIEYRGGRRGYQWGGIICSIGNQVDGTFQTCP